MTDPKSKNQTVQFDAALRIDTVKEFLRRFFAPAIEIAKLLQLSWAKTGLKGKNIHRCSDPIAMVELFDLLRAETFDIESLARDKMF